MFHASLPRVSAPKTGNWCLASDMLTSLPAPRANEVHWMRGALERHVLSVATGLTCCGRQVMWSLPGLSERYLASRAALFETAPSDALGDFATQFAKVGAALVEAKVGATPALPPYCTRRQSRCLWQRSACVNNSRRNSSVCLSLILFARLARTNQTRRCPVVR
jgi:hypothetical protein